MKAKKELKEEYKIHSEILPESILRYCQSYSIDIELHTNSDTVAEFILGQQLKKALVITDVYKQNLLHISANSEIVSTDNKILSIVSGAVKNLSPEPMTLFHAQLILKLVKTLGKKLKCLSVTGTGLSVSLQNQKHLHFVIDASPSFPNYKRVLDDIIINSQHIQEQDTQSFVAGYKMFSRGDSVFLTNFEKKGKRKNRLRFCDKESAAVAYGRGYLDTVLKIIPEPLEIFTHSDPDLVDSKALMFKDTTSTVLLMPQKITKE